MNHTARGDLLRQVADQADAQGDPMQMKTTTLTLLNGQRIELHQWYVDMVLLDVPGSYKVPPDDELLVVGILCHVPEGTPASTRVTLKVNGLTGFETSTVSADAVAHRPVVDHLAQVTRLLQRVPRCAYQAGSWAAATADALERAHAAYAVLMRTATGLELPIHARANARIEAVPSLDVHGIRVTLFALRRIPVL
jgi:hypothetical protein